MTVLIPRRSGKSVLYLRRTVPTVELLAKGQVQLLLKSIDHVLVLLGERFRCVRMRRK